MTEKGQDTKRLYHLDMPLLIPSMIEKRTLRLLLMMLLRLWLLRLLMMLLLMRRMHSDTPTVHHRAQMRLMTLVVQQA